MEKFSIDDDEATFKENLAEYEKIKWGRCKFAKSLICFQFRLSAIVLSIAKSNHIR